MSNSNKAQSIKNTMILNRNRRADMELKVFEVKIDESHLSKQTRQNLKNCFIQAKWVYNFLLSEDVDVFKFDSKTKEINVKIFNPETKACDITETRQLTLGSQIKQSIAKRTAQNIINLSKAKKQGLKVGALKFKKEVKSIPLKQFGVTYKIKGDYISIQGIGSLKCSGLEQVRDGECASANLTKNASGYFIKIICYKKKAVINREGAIGLDFGIKDSIITSDGEKFNFIFPIPKKLKRKHRKLSRQKKNSKRYSKTCKKIKKNYEKLTNKKNDAANKSVSHLKRYETVVIQNENLRGWCAGLFGKQVQQSILGRIKTKIQNLETSVVIDRWLPTTKISPISGKFIDIKLKDRVFQDGVFCEDRDIKSAKTILCFGLYNPKLTSKELRSLPEEERTAIFANYKFENTSSSVEPGSLNALA